MPIAVEHTVHAIAAVVQTVPVGTNLALLHLLWVMLNGAFLRSRGAVFAALAGEGFTRQEVRRSWAALRKPRASTRSRRMTSPAAFMRVWCSRSRWILFS